MSLLERASRAQAVRDADKTPRVDEIERYGLAHDATLILGLNQPVNAAMLRPAQDGSCHRTLYSFEYEGMRFLIGCYHDGRGHHVPLLAVQLEQVRGWPQWPPPDPRNVVKARWAPAGYHAVHRLADLADALGEGLVPDASYG